MARKPALVRIFPSVRKVSVTLGELELRSGEEHAKEALGDQVIELLLVIAEPGEVARRNDGKVVGDFGVVENPLGRHDAAVVQRILGILRQRRVFTADGPDGLLDVPDVVFREVFGIGSRIGQHLVLLIERLGNLQGAPRRVAEAPRGLTLQRCQVKELGRRLGLRLGLLGDDRGHSLAAGLDRLGVGRVPQALGTSMRLVGGFFELLVNPASLVFAGSDLEVGQNLCVRA
jgi:hypothetical protein